jgi:hypothetical protein
MRIERVVRRLRAVGEPGGLVEGPAILLSRVAAVEYQGSIVKVRLEADEIDELTVTLSDHAFHADAVAMGDEVAVGWNDADAHVLI